MLRIFFPCFSFVHEGCFLVRVCDPFYFPNEPAEKPLGWWVIGLLAFGQLADPPVGLSCVMQVA